MPDRMRRFAALFRKEFLQIRRDPLSLKLLFLLPVLQTLIIGYAMIRDVDHVRLGVLDLDRTQESRDVLRALSDNPRFSLREETRSLDEIQNALLRGDITLGVVIPGRFSQTLEETLAASRTSVAPPATTTSAAQSSATAYSTASANRIPSAQIALLVDGEDAASASIAAGYANAILTQWMRERALRNGEAAGGETSALETIDLRDRVLFNPELDYHWYMVPGLVILLTLMIGALLTSFSLVRERESGTLEQLCVTPVSPMQILLGKALPYWILTQISFLFAFVIAGAWFGVPLGNIHPGALLAGLAVFSLATVSLGLFVSNLASSQQQALFLIWFFLVFFVLTSGLLLPFESMPLWMQHLTEFNIVRHFLYAVRAITLRGAVFTEVLPEYLKLSLISVICLAVGVGLFRRKAG